VKAEAVSADDGRGVYGDLRKCEEILSWVHKWQCSIEMIE